MRACVALSPPQASPCGQVSIMMLVARSQTCLQLFEQSPIGRRSQVRPAEGSLYAHVVPPGHWLLSLHASPIALPFPSTQTCCWLQNCPAGQWPWRQPGAHVARKGHSIGLLGIVHLDYTDPHLLVGRLVGHSWSRRFGLRGRCCSGHMVVDWCNPHSRK